MVAQFVEHLHGMQYVAVQVPPEAAHFFPV